MAFQHLHPGPERYKKAVDVFRRGVVVPGTAQGGEVTMKLEMSA